MEARVAARLDARLQSGVAAPIVLALSGGGDSMALLHLAADWAKGRGRRLIAVTVDHGLSPESPAWGQTCRRACEALDVEWMERRWEGDKPATGLTAAARKARHALLAEAAREAGAKVVLMAHTADDVAESDWMRERGTTLGSLRDWSPSPSWPQGRGLMLLRPVLDERRGDLRAYLTAKGAGWIEDPGNADPRFGRSRARAALIPLPGGEGLRLAERSEAQSRKGEGLAAPVGPGQARPSPFRASSDRQPALGRSSPLPTGEGFSLGRDVPRAVLAAAIVCAGGGDQPPRGERLEQLASRIGAGEDFTATLAGARIVAEGEKVLLGREPGDLQRHPVPDVQLEPDRPAVWDGRYEITASEPGWTVTAAAGRMGGLSDADRALLKTATAWARGALPVLIRDDGSAPVLAWRGAEVVALGPRRLDLALSALGLGETTQEADLFRPVHGETPPTDLFSRQDHQAAPVPDAAPRDRGPK